MVTLAPTHPVYAAQEDAYQRDRQAEEYLDGATDGTLALTIVDMALAPDALSAIEDGIAGELAEAFKAGWDAAREQQRYP